VRTPPRAIFLDVMDTLVRDPFHEVMPSFLGMTLAEMLRAKHPTAWVDFELGRIDEPTFLALFLQGRPFDAEGFRSHVRESYALLPGIEELLGDLRRAAPATQLYALSNYPPWYRWIEERCGLARLLDGAFVSYETGVRKPDPAAYLGTMRKTRDPARRGDLRRRPESELRSRLSRGDGRDRVRKRPRAEGRARTARARGAVTNPGARRSSCR
jgi:FMN hydrolase / 5-amino-6-(5-phospho-D-ribitylamino)uracil phosphatase